GTYPGGVHVSHPVRMPACGEFLLAGVEREGLQDRRAGIEELLMELPDGRRMLEDDLRREGTRLHVPAFLELEQVTPVAEDHALLQLIEDPARAFPAAAPFCDHGTQKEGSRL